MMATDFEPEVLVRTLLPAAPRDGGAVDVLIQLIAPPGPARINESNVAKRPAQHPTCAKVDVPVPPQSAQGCVGRSGADVEDSSRTPDQESDLAQTLCWSSVVVTLHPSEDVLSIEPPPRHASRLRLSYPLVDLRFGSESSLLLQLHVKPSVEDSRVLFSVRVRATVELQQEMVVIGGPGPQLNNLDAETLATLPEDEVVVAALLRTKQRSKLRT